MKMKRMMVKERKNVKEKQLKKRLKKGMKEKMLHQKGNIQK
jgi:hypothetical protein